MVSGPRAAGAMHLDAECAGCAGPLAGLRYKCVQCAYYELCAACEASGAHAHHFMLRIPRPLMPPWEQRLQAAAADLRPLMQAHLLDDGYESPADSGVLDLDSSEGEDDELDYFKAELSDNVEDPPSPYVESPALSEGEDQLDSPSEDDSQSSNDEFPSASTSKESGVAEAGAQRKAGSKRTAPAGDSSAGKLAKLAPDRSGPA